MSQESVDVSVIIVSWNVINHLIDCLRSIYKTSEQLNIEVIVVDNASTDQTVEIIRKEFPKVRVIANKKNLGFPHANNQGIDGSRGRHILLLNPDTIVKSHALQKMSRYLDGHLEVGAIGPKLLKENGEIQYSCARSFPTPATWFFKYALLSRLFPRSRVFGRLLLEHWDHLSSREVECLSGACMMIPRRVIEQVGLLDESHPMYFEDLEYCYRLQQAGEKVYYLSEAEVVHYQGQSSRRVLSDTALLSVMASEKFIALSGGSWARVRFRLAVMIATVIRVVAVVSGILLQFVFPSLARKWFQGIWLEREVSLFFWALDLRTPSILESVA